MYGDGCRQLHVSPAPSRLRLNQAEQTASPPVSPGGDHHETPHPPVGDSGCLRGCLCPATVGVSPAQPARRPFSRRWHCCFACFAVDRAISRLHDLEETMTLFSHDRDAKDARMEWTDSISRRSFLVPAVVTVLVLLGLWIWSGFVAGVTRIEAGYVGIEVNLAGSQRGASEIPVRTGWLFYSPLTTQVIEFPTYVQTVKWTRDLTEGHPINEEMGFNSKEGMEIFADVSLSYAIEPGRVPDFYVKYRVNQLDLFTHGILRDIVRNSLNDVASTYTVEDIYGEKKAEFLGKVEQQIQAKVANVGVGVQQFGFI